MARRRRREVLDEIRDHIQVGLEELGPGDEEDVRYYLAQMGTPSEVAAAASGDPAPRTPWLLTASVCAGLVGLVALLGVLTTSAPAPGPASQPASIATPHLVGMSEEAAQADLSSDHLGVLVVLRSGHMGAAPGTVFEQTPVPGTRLTRAAMVIIYVAPRSAP